MTMATASIAPRMYLLEASQDSGWAVELKKRSGASDAGNPSAAVGVLSAAAGVGVACSALAKCPAGSAVGVGVAAESFEAEVTSESPVGWVIGAGRGTAPVSDVGLAGSWPRHCFSSHSTQYVRPRDTGKPQA